MTTDTGRARYDLAAFVKAYDVRGLVGEQLDETVARALGAAFAEGVASRGLDVVLAGLLSTDALYYASGALDAPGAMFTASHNPAAYNGIKMCRAGARPIGQDTGLARIRDRAQELLDGALRSSQQGRWIDTSGVRWPKAG